MSGDVMQFPKTVEEFMEKYKIIDSEQVYTNGAELVPIFRMEQWFEHLRHGKWKIKTINTFDMAYGTTGYEPVYQCSVCGGIEESYLRLDEPIMPEDADFPRYCPNCGASMEGEEGWIKHLEVVHFVTEAKDEDY